MKKLLLITSIILTSCINHPWIDNQQDTSKHPRCQTPQVIEVVDHGLIGGHAYYVVYDTHTKVMYVYGLHTFTPLLNPDGTPRLYGDPS